MAPLRPRAGRRLAVLLAMRLALGGGAADLAAQWPCDPTLRAPAAGAFVEWAVRRTGDGGGTSVLFAYLGQDAAGYRLELLGSPGGGGMEGQTVLQIVAPRFPYTGEGAREMIMQMGANPPVKLVGTMMGMMQSRVLGLGTSAKGGCPTTPGDRATGTERITTAAGTFATRGFRTQDGDTYWVSDEVPFGLVRWSGSQSIELRRIGAGYQSRLRGTPLSLPNPPR